MCSCALNSVLDSRISGSGERIPHVMDPKSARTSRILIVEGEQETRDAIEKLLLRDGYRVDAARDEHDAVERIQRNRPDLILVSLQGTTNQLIGASQRIRHRGGLSLQIPVVIFSHAILPEGVEPEFGGNIHVIDPDSFNQLRGLIMRLLRQILPSH
jgi:CheY-like chemotaxis protein